MTLSSLVGSNIDQMLKIITQRYHKPYRPPVDIEAIARSLGADIVYKPMLVEGILEELAQNRYLIKINSASIKVRQRFTIAHEAAHIILKLADQSKTVRLFEHSLPEEEILCNRSENEGMCNKISASLLIPRQVAEQLSDWKSLSIQKIEKASRKWQVSISVLLRHVLYLAPYVGGFIWYKIDDKSDDPTEVRMRYYWSAFPKSYTQVPRRDVWLYASEHSPIDFSGTEERFFAKGKLEFDGLSGCRVMRLKVFGKGDEKRALVIIYPKEIRPESILSSKRLRQSILQLKS